MDKKEILMRCLLNDNFLRSLLNYFDYVRITPIDIEFEGHFDKVLVGKIQQHYFSMSWKVGVNGVLEGQTYVVIKDEKNEEIKIKVNFIFS